MKQYGLYCIKENEQCEYFGTIKEISNYLKVNPSSLYSHLSRKKHGKIKYLNHKYDIVEIEDKDDEDIFKKTNKEIWKELLKIYGFEYTTIKEEILKFKKFDEINWKLKGQVNQLIYNEKWKQIPGFTYSISNYGRVRNDKNGKLKVLRNHRWIIQVDI